MRQSHTRYIYLEKHFIRKSSTATFLFLQNLFSTPCVSVDDAHFQYGRNFVERIQQQKSFLRTNRSVYVIACNLDDNDNVIKKCRGGKRKNAIFVRIEFNLNVFIGFRLFCLYVLLFFFTFIDKLSFITEEEQFSILCSR